MFDLGWTEMMVIGIVALIVVGPKDLPVLFRNIGRFVGKAKGMAREFSRAMNDAADEAGVRDMGKTLRSATNPVNSAMDGVKDAARSFSDWDPEKPSKSAKAEAKAEGGLSPERAEAAEKIQKATAQKAAERRAREEAAAEEAAEEADDLADIDDFDPAYFDEPEPAPAAKPAKPAKSGAKTAAKTTAGAKAGPGADEDKA